MERLSMNTLNSITFEEGCSKYIENCRQRNLREATINHYKQSYKQFYKYFNPEMLISDFTEKDYNGFIIY